MHLNVQVRGLKMVDIRDGDDADLGVLEDTAGTPVAQANSAADSADISGQGVRVRAGLKARLGEDVYSSWFNSLEFRSFDGRVLTLSVPVKFLKKWIETHYSEALLECCRLEFNSAERIEIVQRQPEAVASSRGAPGSVRLSETVASGQAQSSAEVRHVPVGRVITQGTAAGARYQVNGLEGSPLDPRYTFDSFMVGPSNRMSHAAATQVAETVLAEERGFNPLYVHSPVGHGKTHLLHAIAWDVRRRVPGANVLYLTAERFRFQFVEALRAQDAMAFKDRFRAIDMLLIDDLEFMHGEKTELEFDHIINTLLDSGRQLVVASARPPAQLTRLNDRMRSRLQRGLVTEMGALDYDLRFKILARRVQDKRAIDASFDIPDDAVALLAERLTESGRELEGVVTRLFATWQYMRTPITLEIVDAAIRDLVHGIEPRRIKIEDILRIISRHYGVSKGDILSQRRHRSVVWPRQIGMYLAKQLTSRSLPEIGRRFGGRDHTTVLHAIRKIEGELGGNARLKDEIEELKKQLSN
jgi:chromosomal replication initiator protein